MSKKSAEEVKRIKDGHHSSREEQKRERTSCSEEIDARELDRI